MTSVISRYRSFVLIALAAIILLLLSVIPVEGKFGILEIKKIDMFCDIKAEENV